MQETTKSLPQKGQLFDENSIYTAFCTGVYTVLLISVVGKFLSFRFVALTLLMVLLLMILLYWSPACRLFFLRRDSAKSLSQKDTQTAMFQQKSPSTGGVNKAADRKDNAYNKLKDYPKTVGAEKASPENIAPRNDVGNETIRRFENRNMVRNTELKTEKKRKCQGKQKESETVFFETDAERHDKMLSQAKENYHQEEMVDSPEERCVANDDDGDDEEGEYDENYDDDDDDDDADL